MSTPTIKQMKARMLSGHRQVLEAVRDGKKLDARSDGEWRGFRKVIVTLKAWGAIDDNGITEIGQQLLA
jgi:hypothetical protein